MVFSIQCLVLLATVSLCECYSVGTPPGHCWDLEPRHGYYTTFQDESTSPFFITIVDAEKHGENLVVRGGEEVNIMIHCMDPYAKGFRGFLVIAEVGHGETRERVGSFRSNTNLTQPSCRDMTGITHTEGGEKTQLNITWTAPPYPFEGEVTIWGTIVQTYDNYWIEIMGTSKIDVIKQLKSDSYLYDELDDLEEMGDYEFYGSNAAHRSCIFITILLMVVGILLLY